MSAVAGAWGKNHDRAAAFVTAAAVMLVPANVLPVLGTDMPGESRTDTIFSGIVGLCDDGSWGVAAIVFTASILVPLLKIGGVATLLYAVRSRPVRHRRTLTRLYSALDFIGRWSMLDVFLVAFLSGAVQFGGLAQVRPEPGAIAFAAVVVLTMLATDAFDPHVLWSDGQPTGTDAP
jgi:paraquat-inducible protein A